jgi:hypothetical protein
MFTRGLLYVSELTIKCAIIIIIVIVDIIVVIIIIIVIILVVVLIIIIKRYLFLPYGCINSTVTLSISVSL